MKKRKLEIYSKVFMCIGAIAFGASILLILLNLFVDYYEWEKNIITVTCIVGCLIYLAGFKMYVFVIEKK